MDDAFRVAVATRTGYDPDAIILTDDPAYRLLESNFNIVVAATLESYPWHWNEQPKDLLYLNYIPPVGEEPVNYTGVITVPTEGEGQQNYLGELTLPDEVLYLRGVHQQGDDLRYDRKGKQVLLWSYDPNRGVNCIVQMLCDTQLWPELFRDAIISKMAGMVSVALMQRTSMGKAFDDLANRSLEILKGVDSQQQTVPRIKVGRIATARRASYTSLRRPMRNQHNNG